jgi:hypothetical protein
MTDTDKNINGPAEKVELAVSPITDAPRDVAKSAEEQTKDAARKVFNASQAATKPAVANASLSAADGSASNTTGS